MTARNAPRAPTGRGRGRARDAARRGGGNRRGFAAAVIAALVLSLAAWAYHVTGGTPAVVARATGHREAAGGGPAWLARLNHYRRLAKLDPVVEDPALSRGDANHARYVVANEGASIRSGRIGASIHTEDPKKPFFTPEGRTAGEVSNVDADFSYPPTPPAPGWAIENWITGPFHRLWLLNPELRRVGYGQFCEKGICAAALNVQSGIEDPAGPRAAPASSTAVMFPSDESTVADGTFAADETEWPDPLTPCRGYENPTGIPITLSLGRGTRAVLNSFSLKRGGAPAEACGYDADSYINPDPNAADRARSGLRHFGAVVIVPRKPLVPGAAYMVTATVSGRPYVWRFTVAP